MRFLRSVTVVILFIIFGFGAGVISFILFPVGKFFVKKENQKNYYSNIIHNSWKIFTWVLEKIKIIRLEAENKEEIKNLRGKIIVSSHRSFIDIVILIGLIPKSICLAKKEVMTNPLFKNIVDSIYITNDADLDEFKNETAEALEQGFNIIIFPTGKRNKPDEDIKLHKGPAMISIHSGVPIRPIKLETSYDFLQLDRPIYEAGDRPVVFSLKLMPEIDPIELEKETNSAISLRNLITKKIKEYIS